MDPLAQVAVDADRVAESRLALDVAADKLRQSIVAADARGTWSRNVIAVNAARGLSRKKVLATLAAHDLEEAARAALAGLPVVVATYSDRVRIRLDFAPALDFPASERAAAAAAAVRALGSAGIVLSDAADPGHDFSEDLAEAIKYVTVARASRPDPRG